MILNNFSASSKILVKGEGEDLVATLKPLLSVEGTIMMTSSKTVAKPGLNLKV